MKKNKTEALVRSKLYSQRGGIYHKKNVTDLWLNNIHQNRIKTSILDFKNLKSRVCTF